jgi:hypothetical protein
MELLNTWLAYLGLGGLGLGAMLGAAWFFGLMPVVGAVANVLAAVLGPILKAVVEGVIWTWQNVLWPGLRDILDDWVTIVTVLLMGFLLWSILLARFEVQESRLERQVAACKVELKKRPPAPRRAPEPQFRWPWE